MADAIDTDVECTLPEAWQPVLQSLGIDAFDLDPCTNRHATVLALHGISLPHDGLTAPWFGAVWCNPPYSDPKPWIKRCAEHDDTTVALVKCDTATSTWRELIWPTAQLVCFPFRRLKFFQPAKPARAATAKWANALIFWRLNLDTFNPEPLEQIGKLVIP